MYIKKDRQNNHIETHPNGNVYFYSYQTLVAIAFPAIKVVAYTEKKWSVTTTKHIRGFTNAYARDGFVLQALDQETLEMEFLNKA